MFWIRLANKDYELNEFDDYGKHFTVMNYSPFPMRQLHYKDFIAGIESQYPGTCWPLIQQKINELIRKVFRAFSVCLLEVFASGNAPEMCLEQSRAMYGIDIMLDKDFEPKLLEVNFNPDTHRACDYDSKFYDNVFSVLFLERQEDEVTSMAWNSVTEI